MLAQETARLPLLSDIHGTATPELVAQAPFGPPDQDWAEADAHPINAPDRRWDPLLFAVAAYLLIAVGRVHQLFSVLEIIHPGTLTGLLAIVLYASDRQAHWRLLPCRYARHSASGNPHH